MLLLVTASAALAQNKGPTDWSEWQTYRGRVQHPAAAFKAADLARARRNIERYTWAKRYLANLRKNADGILPQVTADYLARMIERTTPGCVGPCPACRAKGLPWHPNGQWSWSASKPDQLICSVCKTVFPNDEFPESIVLQSKWDPEQRFGFIGGEPFRCHGYVHARPSISGIIRANKVSHATGQLHILGLAYALTEDPKYARGAKAILLRFAEVLPKYLVRAGYGYGEYADSDPHVAAERITNLPQEELVYPPNKPDRKLYAGYWAASRIGTSGMDGGWVCRVVQAYDLTCSARDGGAAVYSEQERIHIERDVLLESTYLAVCDPAINNKSVGNRAGAAMVGMCVGHPGLVRFGLEGLRSTVDGWFLPDGGTSESSGYALMTMSGIQNLALVLRNYSDPAGYAGPDGQRLDHFDSFRDTRYGDCWQSLIWTLQGDLRHPPSADSYRTTSIGSSFAELIAIAYPNDEHVAFLKELAGKDLGAGAGEQALFLREPGLESRAVPAFALHDVVFPFLAQAYLRTGATGRSSLALLNASNWGNHHHLDSLDLYYWKDGRELLSDLGYLWDHPDKKQTNRSGAHNLVMVDGEDQKTVGRAGSFHLFAITPHVKATEASSNAYDKAPLYRRTCIQIDHGEAGSYLVDIFRLRTGAKCQYVFHGPGNDFESQGLNFASTAQPRPQVPFALRFQLSQVSGIFVDGVEIREILPDHKEGPNLAPDASVPPAANDTALPGWGYYAGDGKGEWGAATPGRSGKQCVRLQALRPHSDGRMNVALLAGQSDGYSGAQVIRGTLGAKYKVRFWLKGDALLVNVDAVLWLGNPKSPDNRRYVDVTHVAASKDWKQYEGTFTLPNGTLSLDNQRQASGDAPWQIIWRMDKDYRFTAFSPGNRAETVTLGSGWGQRDYRNTDRDTSLPYVIRTVEGGVLSQFISVFVGEPKARPLVKAVRRLPLSQSAPSDAVAVEVETVAGTDVLVSMLTPAPVKLSTSAGELATDGRIAAVLMATGKPAAASLIGGTRLVLAEANLSCPHSNYCGKLVGVSGSQGESWFIVEGELPNPSSLVGQTVFVEDGMMRRAYPIRLVKPDGSRTRIYTKLGGVGFEAGAGKTWDFIPTVNWQRP